MWPFHKHTWEDKDIIRTKTWEWEDMVSDYPIFPVTIILQKCKCGKYRNQKLEGHFTKGE